MKLRLLYYELQKLLSLKYVVLFAAALLAVNAVIFALSENIITPSSPSAVDAEEERVGYTDKLDAIIKKAKRNLAVYESRGYRSDSYLIKSQKTAISRYSELYDLEFIDEEVNSGTANVFTYDTDIIFFLISALIAVTAVFFVDAEKGTMQFIRDTKYGGAQLCLAKTVCAVIVSAVLGLSFFLIDLATTRIFCGALPMSQPIQVYSRFMLCPYKLTVGDAVISSLMLRFFFAVFISLFIGVISVITKQKTAAQTAFLLFCGTNYLIKMFANEQSFLSGVSIFRVSSLSWQLEDLRVLLLFGTAAEYERGIGWIYLLVGVMAVLGIFVLFPLMKTLPHGKTSVSPGAVLVRRIHKESQRPVCRAPKSLSVSLYELRKLCTPTKNVIFLVLVLIKLAAAYNAYYADNGYDAQAYKEYIKKFEGLINSAAVEEIRETRERINKISEDSDKYLTEYQNGSISRDEYMAFKNEYYETMSFESVFACVEKQVNYLCDLSKNEGINGWVLYDGGWNHFFGRKPDFVLILMIITLLSDIGSIEYGSMFPILHTLKNGREPVVRAKLRVGALASAMLGAVFSMIDVVFICFNYGLSCPRAPIASLMELDALQKLSICAAAVVSVLLQAAGCAVISNVVVCLSVVLRRSSLAMALTALSVVLPYIFDVGYGGVCGLIDGHTLLLSLLEHGRSLPRFLSAAACLVLLAAVSVACVIASNRLWRKRSEK